MNGIDRRRTPRIPLTIPLRLQIHDPPQNIPHIVSGKSFDISRSGIGVNLKNLLLPQGLSGIVNIDLPDATLKVECRIAWSNISVKGESRCGIYFAKVEGDHISILNRILTQTKEERKRKFAFISNLRDAGDLQRVAYTSKFLPRDKDLPTLIENPGYILWSHFNVFNKVDGYIIIILKTGKEIIEAQLNGIKFHVLKAALFAQNELGVDYIGLGSYIPSVTSQGRWLESRSEIRAYLTHGDHLTTWIALEGIRERIGLNLADINISIIGASGLIGQGLSRVLAKYTRKLTLIGRNYNKLSRLKEKILLENNHLVNEPIITTDISSIKNSDLIVSVTSSPDAIIKEEYLKKGVIIYDLAQPMDVTPELCKKRPDIYKIDGGFVKIPGIELGIEMGPPKGNTFACLGDVILQCLEDTKHSFVGPIDPIWVEQIGKIAQSYGFRHADLSCFSWPIPEVYLSKRVETESSESVTVLSNK